MTIFFEPGDEDEIESLGIGVVVIACGEVDVCIFCRGGASRPARRLGSDLGRFGRLERSVKTIKLSKSDPFSVFEPWPCSKASFLEAQRKR